MKNLAIFFLLISLKSHAQLNVAGIFGDNAVIQQGISAPVWGEARAGSVVEVSLGKIEAKSISDEFGKWVVYLPPLKSDGKCQELIIKCGSEKEVFKNIQIGEVWLASGQSNMQWKIKDGLENKEQEMKNANYPDIRFYHVDYLTSVKPLDDTRRKDWQICTPGNEGDFSAVSYFFARSLHLDRKVPVGIIVAARGATNLESWMSREKLITHPDFTQFVEEFDTDTTRWNNKVRENLMAEKDREEIANTAKTGLNLKVHTNKYNDSGWQRTRYPINMNNMGYSGYWGLVWIRKTFDLHRKSLSKDWNLYLPIADINDIIYLNGKEIAVGVARQKEKKIKLNSIDLKSGSNLLAVRMYVNWGSAEIGNLENQCYLLSANGEKVELDGLWSHNNKIEPAVAQWQNYYNTSTVNFNGMINPIIPYGIRGFLWYQGENNAGKGPQYTELQPMLTEDWRIRWGLGYLPFLYVQLASYRETFATPKEKDGMAEFRDAQTRILSKSPNSAMACTIDIGDPYDIHPKNKQDVGKRLYLAAKAKAYGADIIYSGPMFKRAVMQEGKVIISFSFAQNGLRTNNHEPVKGFAIADSSGKWFWADASISGNQVTLSSKGISEPVRVQYAWQSNPESNLYNNEGLPAVPFKENIKR